MSTDQAAATSPSLPELLDHVEKDPDAAYDAFTAWAQGSGHAAVPAPGRGAAVPARRGERRPLHARPGRASRSCATGAHFAALADDRVSFYTAPIKALVSEKFFALCEIFGAERGRHAHR